MKKLEVNKTWIPNKTELYSFFDDILESGQLTNNGKYVKKLEDTLKEQTDVKHAYATGNGTIALHIALKALEITEGEIITTAFSFIATASSILWERCTPIFVDIDPNTLCIDANVIESKITSKTKAIMSVHVFGNTGDIEHIEAIAKKHKISTIYDGAHAFGTRYNGKSVFQYGSVSTLSMHTSKIVSAVEGGAIFTNDDELAERVFKIRYFGKDKDNYEEILGTNGKMNEFNAAFALLSIENFKKEKEKRKKIDTFYRLQLKEIQGIDLTIPNKKAEINYSYFPVILKSEEEVHKIIAKAKSKNIIIRRYWYPALNSIAFINRNPNDTPIAYSVANRVVCLPIYKSLNEEDIARVVNLFKE